MDTLDFFASFLRSTHISIPEAVMFISFGVSWPVSLFKTLRTKKVTGKSPFFMVLIIIGYMSGITHKIIFSRDILIVLYLINLSMVVADLCLYFRYHAREHECGVYSWQLGRGSSFLRLRKTSQPDYANPVITSNPIFYDTSTTDFNLQSADHKCFLPLG